MADKKGGSGSHGARHTRAKVEKSESDKVTDKKMRDQRPYSGSSTDVKRVTGKMPEGSRRGPTPVDDE